MTVWSIIQTIVMLLVVIYLINISLKLLAKHGTQKDATIQIIQKIAVTKTSALAIVKIVDQYYVMSLADQQNQIIRELTPAEQVQVAADITNRQKNATKPQQLGGEFTKILLQKLGKGK
jgi:flagellar protein FliO/FliZ